MKKGLLSLVLLALALAGRAQTPTWSNNVANIVYSRCASCHHDGGIAPFALMSYLDAVSNASVMKAALQAGIMPPWPPDVTWKHYANERVLSSAEKNELLSWLDNGRPPGDLSQAPNPPVFNNIGDLPGTPDLIAKITTYTSAAATNDVYRCFVIPSGLATDKYITSMEALPGNRSIVHHVLIYADTTGASTTLDAADPGPGYTSFGGIGVPKPILLGGWVPGTGPMKFPAGFGKQLPAHSNIVVQIHYPAGTAGLKDSTEIHMFFAAPGSVRNVYILAALNHSDNINTPLVIPANTVKEFSEQLIVPDDATLMGVAPHMHLIGKSIESFGVTPAGDTQKYIRIANWDFHWQGFYFFKQAVKVPKSATVFARAVYDNTSANPNNPNNPPKLVTAGEQTTDEMMIVYFIFANYQPGDENLIIDPTNPAGVNSAAQNISLLQVLPIPAQDHLVVRIVLNAASTADLEVVDIQGRIVQSFFRNKKLATGQTEFSFDTQSLPAGNYVLRMRSEQGMKTQRFSVLR
jgi:hypothetical protein